MFSFCKKIGTFTTKRCFSTLFIAEHNNQKLASSNLNGITAALRLNEKVLQFINHPLLIFIILRSMSLLLVVNVQVLLNKSKKLSQLTKSIRSLSLIILLLNTSNIILSAILIYFVQNP